MIQYQSTPDYYREYIEHGWFSDTAKKAHKYIKKYVNDAGNTIYVYKTKAQTAIDNYKRERGRQKAYKDRKDQIETSRRKTMLTNKRKAQKAWWSKTMRENMIKTATAQKKARDAAKKKRIEEATASARKSYEDRKPYVRDSRGRTRHNYALKKQGYVYYKGKKLYK